MSRNLVEKGHEVVVNDCKFHFFMLHHVCGCNCV